MPSRQLNVPLPQVDPAAVDTDVVGTVEGTNEDIVAPIEDEDSVVITVVERAIGCVFLSPLVTCWVATVTASVDVETTVVPKCVVAPAVTIFAVLAVVTVEMSPSLVQSLS